MKFIIICIFSFIFFIISRKFLIFKYTYNVKSYTSNKEFGYCFIKDQYLIFTKKYWIGEYIKNIYVRTDLKLKEKVDIEYHSIKCVQHRYIIFKHKNLNKYIICFNYNNIDNKHLIICKIYKKYIQI